MEPGLPQGCNEDEEEGSSSHSRGCATGWGKIPNVLLPEHSQTIGQLFLKSMKRG